MGEELVMTIIFNLMAAVAGAVDLVLVSFIDTLYVMPFDHNRGIGKKMVDYACLQAKERGATTVIALSTQSFGFFINVCGFEETGKENLPEARLKQYEESGRNAKVLLRRLG